MSRLLLWGRKGNGVFIGFVLLGIPVLGLTLVLCKANSVKVKLVGGPHDGRTVELTAAGVEAWLHGGIGVGGGTYVDSGRGTMTWIPLAV